VQCFSILITIYVGLRLPFRFTSLNLRVRITISLDTTDPSVAAPSTSIRPMFLVPFERDTQFVGREDILSQVEERLQNQRRVSFHGLGGIGYYFPINNSQIILTEIPENPR
jgi:hypothetical protein